MSGELARRVPEGACLPLAGADRGGLVQRPAFALSSQQLDFLSLRFLSKIRPSYIQLRFPGGSDGKESTCQCSRCEFDPWVEKIPRRRE